MKNPNTLVSGMFDGLRGLSIEMTLEQAFGASTQGQNDEAVALLVQLPEIKKQLREIGAEKIREALREYGAWSRGELKDNEANYARAVWSAAHQIREEFYEAAKYLEKHVDDDQIDSHEFENALYAILGRGLKEGEDEADAWNEALEAAREE